MAQIVYSGVCKETKLSRREQLMLLEIENDLIDTASSFVDYMREGYGFSKSSIWYCLNRLKESGLVEFANRDEPGKPLRLTKNGLAELVRLSSMRNTIVMYFSNSFMNAMQKDSVAGRHDGYIRNRAYISYR